MAHAIAREFHDRCHTALVYFTAREVRQQWYISCLTPYLKKVKKACYTCQKLDQTVVQVEIGALPSFQFLGSSPNFTIATDMLGPFHIRRARAQTRGTGRQKVWLLFAANIYSRQAHCTGLDSQSLNDLMQGFQELFVHTGKPTRICTDVGSNFQSLAARHGKSQQVSLSNKKDEKAN